MAHKVVYNSCYGGFSFSEKAAWWLMKNGSEEIKEHLRNALFGAEDPQSILLGYHIDGHFPRHHKDLVAVVEALGCEANGPYARLRIQELSGNKYWIEEYDGVETVHEPETIDWVTIED